MLWREREQEESRQALSKEIGAEWNEGMRSSRPPRNQHGSDSSPLVGSIAAISLWTSSHERRFWTLMLRRVASGFSFSKGIPAMETSRLCPTLL